MSVERDLVGALPHIKALVEEDRIGEALGERRLRTGRGRKRGGGEEGGGLGLGLVNDLGVGDADLESHGRVVVRQGD